MPLMSCWTKTSMRAPCPCELPSMTPRRPAGPDDLNRTACIGFLTAVPRAATAATGERVIGPLALRRLDSVPAMDVNARIDDPARCRVRACSPVLGAVGTAGAAPRMLTRRPRAALARQSRHPGRWTRCWCVCWFRPRRSVRRCSPRQRLGPVEHHAVAGLAGRASIGFLALDLAIYVQHVVFHKVPLLWRLHRMHHADLDIDVTTGVRFHPIEICPVAADQDCRDSAGRRTGGRGHRVRGGAQRHLDVQSFERGDAGCGSIASCGCSW